MVRLVRLFLLCCLLAVSVAGYAETVIHVHDGDSLWFEGRAKVRVWGVDTPELGQPLALEAKKKLKALALGKDLKCIPHGRSYKRQVCQLMTANGVDIAAELVKDGLAYEDLRYSGGHYTQLEQQAETAGVGVWSLPDGGVRPWDWRKMK